MPTPEPFNCAKLDCACPRCSSFRERYPLTTAAWALHMPAVNVPLKHLPNSPASEKPATDFPDSNQNKTTT